MKSLKLSLMFILLAFLCVENVDAQFLKKLGQKAEEAAKRGTEKAVERKVEEKTEQAVEEIIDDITDPENYKSSDDNDNSNTSTQNAEPVKPKAPPVACNSVSASSKSVPATTKDKQYPFEHGTIYQQISAMGMETNPVIYFDKYGDWTSQETIMEMKVLWKNVKTHIRDITKGDDKWSLDFEQKTGTHSKLSAVTALDPLALTMANDMVKDMKIEQLGEVDYLGYKCTKQRVTSAEYQIDLVTVTHGNMTMMAEGTTMGIPTSIYVTKVDLSSPQKNMFEVPSDFKITEASK